MAGLVQARSLPADGADWESSVAYLDGRYVALNEAHVSLFDWGFTRSDVTYDVVHVWHGRFFRLADHIARFQASLAGLRLTVHLDGEGIAGVLGECVRRSGLRDAYVAMLCTRGRPRPGQPRLPSSCENRFMAYAVPWVNVIPPEVQERGAHLIISRVPRIAPDSVDPTIKNYHWGDMTRALFEVEDQGADNAVLLDREGYVTEGPGFNVFAVIGGEVISPDRGALEGITRKSVMEICDELGIPKRIRRLTGAELIAADEVFCATTAGGVMPASRIGATILSNDRPGPISTRLRDRYWEKHAEGWHATPIDYD